LKGLEKRIANWE